MRQSDPSSATSANVIASKFQMPYFNTTQPQFTPEAQPFTPPQYVWVTAPMELTLDRHQRVHSPAYKLGDKVGYRYWVISSHIWQDTQPRTPCNLDGYVLSEPVLSYLRLQSYSLHLPTLYGVLELPQDADSSAMVSKPTSPIASSMDSNSWRQDTGTGAIALLLDNVPIDCGGQLLPSIQERWSTASAVRQLQWLWQLMELWQVLSRWEQTASLLAPLNIRVDGWRVRLVNVWSNAQWRHLGGAPVPFATGQRRTNGTLANLTSITSSDRPLQWQLGQLWQTWVNQGHPSLVRHLTQLCQQLQQATSSWSRIKQDLNQLMLQHAAQQPLRIAIAGGSRAHTDPAYPSPPNDICYPNGLAPLNGLNDDAYDVSAEFIAPKPWEELDPYVAILCDGVNDLVRGAMASQLVTRSLKLQLSALLTEIESYKTRADVIAADVLEDQLAAIVRIVNNVLLAHNHAAETAPLELDDPSVGPSLLGNSSLGHSSLGHSSLGHSLGHPGSGQSAPPPPTNVGTTATLAIQIPQSITTPQGNRNSHELYIAGVGNSRAYWLTPTHCHRLTDDDNVAARTVVSQLGRGRISLQEPTGVLQTDERRGWSYHDAHLQPGAARLTQALGMKEGEKLTIQVRRFIIDEDGLLLLCSNTLGDRVETHWQSLATRLLQTQRPLNEALEEWLDLLPPLPHSSVVVMRCHLSAPHGGPSPSLLEDSFQPGSLALLPLLPHGADLATAPAAELEDRPEDTEETTESHTRPTPWGGSRWRSLLGQIKTRLSAPFNRVQSRSSEADAPATIEESLDLDPFGPLPSLADMSVESTPPFQPLVPIPEVTDAQQVSSSDIVLASEHMLVAQDTATLSASDQIDAEAMGQAMGQATGQAIGQATAQSMGQSMGQAKAQATGQATAQSSASWHWMQLLFGCTVVMVGAIALGLATWRYFDPVLFDRVVVRSTEKFLEQVQERYPWLEDSSNLNSPRNE